MAVQRLSGEFDLSKVFQYWDTGAKELEKSTVGKIVTAPVRLVESATSSAQNVLREVPRAAVSAAKTVPFILIIAAVGVAGYLIFAGKKGVKLIP